MNARWGLAIFLGIPLLLLVGLVLLVPRDGDVPPAPDERVVARVPSPDGRRAATVVEISLKAPVVDGYVVRVGSEDAFSVAGTKRVEVRWRDANTLEVDFDHARQTRIGKARGLRVVTGKASSAREHPTPIGSPNGSRRKP